MQTDYVMFPNLNQDHRDNPGSMVMGARYSSSADVLRPFGLIWSGHAFMIRLN